MKPVILYLLVFCQYPAALYSLDSRQQRQADITHKFIDAYNRQDYAGMKKLFTGTAKLHSLNKYLRSEFVKKFNILGKASIDTIVYLSSGHILAELSYEKDEWEKQSLVIFLNQRNRIEGMGFRRPGFVYPKTISATRHLSATEKEKAINALCLKYNADRHFNGCVAAIDSGRLIYMKSLGYANFDTKAILNDSAVFELASVSKQFTAMAIIMLVEQGKLHYSDTLQKFFPGLPYTGITVKNLLTHTSGLPDYMGLMSKHWDKRRFATNADIVTMLERHHPKPYFKPDQAFYYSNTGYTLLSLIIEKTSGMSYAEFLGRYIFKPLGMNHTFVYNTRRSKGEKISNYAYGYVYSERLERYILPDSLPGEYSFYLDEITGDGSVNSSVGDLLLWDRALRNNTLVSKMSMDSAYRSHKLANGRETGYGYGLYSTVDTGSERLCWHAGGWQGYSSFILRFIDQDCTVIILSNNEYEDVTGFGHKVVGVLRDEE